MKNTRPPESIRVTKLDAARRQLHAAIDLWFLDKDPVSIHTLLYAAHEIIHQLYRRKGLQGLFFDGNAVKGNSEVIKVIKEWPNFFKHAKRDGQLESFVDFRPEANLIFFSACITGMDGLGESRSDATDALVLWLFLHYRDYFPKASPYNRIPAADRKVMRSLSKQEFLEDYLRGRNQRRRPPSR